MKIETESFNIVIRCCDSPNVWINYKDKERTSYHYCQNCGAEIKIIYHINI